MSKIVSIVKKIALASLAMVVFFGLTAQIGERSTGKVKKLYEKEEVEERLKEIEELENTRITENHLRNIINAKAKEECNEEIAKQSGGGFIFTNEPINVIIDRCVKRKTPKMWNRRDEFKKAFQKEIRDLLEKAKKALTLEGCREVAKEDKECTDDLIVKFDRFGTCICETY